MGLSQTGDLTIAELKRLNLAFAASLAMLCFAVILLVAGQVRSDGIARRALAEAAACRP